MPVTLNQVWLHDAVDPENYLRFYTIDRADDRERGGAIRSYAGGRRRIITTPNRQQAIPATFRAVTSTQLDQLDDWAGELLMYRDHMGRLEFGTYFKLAIADYKDRSGYDVTITFETITYSIEV